MLRGRLRQTLMHLHLSKCIIMPEALKENKTMLTTLPFSLTLPLIKPVQTLWDLLVPGINTSK